MPSRFVAVACAMVVILGLAVGPLTAPRSVLAVETAVAAYETPLRAGPTADAAIVASIPMGASLTLNGAPDGAAYPVAYGGTSGWVDGAALAITKGALAAMPAPPATDPAPPADGALAPFEATAADAALAPETTDIPAADPAAIDPATDPALTPTPTGAELIATAVGEAGDDPAAIATAALANDEPVAPIDPAATAEPTAAEIALPPDTTPATPVAEAPAAATAAETVTSAAPTAEPTTVAAVPPPEASADLSPTTDTTEPTEPLIVWGPARAADDLSLFSGPDTGSAVLFYVPAGSTLTRTGTTRGEFVSADFMGIIGWVHRDYLAEPAAPADEAAPTGTAVPVRTPRPGSGVAFATVELPVRAGPSANEPTIGSIPAGSRVVLTGVMENGFQRIDYRDLVGWVADTFLSTPADPPPVLAPPSGVGGGRPDDDGRPSKTYSEREIIRIIEQAADRYGQSRSDMLRVARCESNLDPNAVNPSGSYGLFQFIRSTWKSTPYGSDDIFDPHANANAAAWMWSQGRRAEWVCQ